MLIVFSIWKQRRGGQTTVVQQKGHYSSMAMFETILLPVDGSPESERAVPFAIDVARKYQSKILLVSVIDIPTVVPGELSDEQQQQFTEAKTKVETRAQGFIDSARQTLETESIPVEGRIEEGKAAFIICDVADEVDAGLIVMGTRGLGLIEGEKSVSDQVINLAPCPVLVVP
jgi:nucleotide-binding universal stress UspA family protein